MLLSLVSTRSPESLGMAIYALRQLYTDFSEAGIDLPEVECGLGTKPFVFRSLHTQNGLTLECAVRNVSDNRWPMFCMTADLKLADGSNTDIVTLKSHASTSGWVRRVRVGNCKDLWLSGLAPCPADGIEINYIASVDVGKTTRYIIARLKGRRLCSWEKES
jgi:hypothetical protein